MTRNMPLRIAVLASWRGSNLQAIIDAIEAGELDCRLAVVVSDRADAQALDGHGRYKPAIVLYRKCLTRCQLGGFHSRDYLLGRIEELRNKESFRKAMEKAEPWERATATGSREFLIQTNIPHRYHAALFDQLKEIIQKEKNLLQEILGAPKNEPPPVKIFVAGREEEYLQLLGSPSGVFSYAYYFPEKEATFVLFNGALDKLTVAHEVTHHLIRAYHVRNPSTLLSEGLAEYLSYKVAKSSARARLLDRIEAMHWLSDQGQWERALDIFPLWKLYSFDRKTQLIQKSREWARTREVADVFYLRAWSLIYFFIEGQNDFFVGLFRRYLDYEKNNPANDYQTSLKFFNENLTPEQIKDLDHQWGRFTLEAAYEKI